LPEVIALRRAFLPESDRMRFLPSSVLDPSWLEALPDEPGPRFLFVAEGLFMYLPPEGVKTLVLALHDRHQGAELVAEVATIVRMMHAPLGRSKFRRQFGLSTDVVYQFGLHDSHDMEQWSPGLVLLDEWTYFDEPEPRLGWMRLLARWPLFRRAQWTVHYRLGRPADQVVTEERAGR
jgi:O-methyltransferase involved in polyketide biosynthesis